jgi:hypothetical protein
MNLDDEELQRAIEEGKLHDLENPDAKAYKILFDSLSHERNEKLSPVFADKVIQRAVANNQKNESSKDMWWLGIGIFLMSICLIVSIALVGANFNLGFLKGIADYSGLLFAGAVLITIFNILDKRILKQRHDMQ